MMAICVIQGFLTSGLTRRCNVTDKNFNEYFSGMYVTEKELAKLLDVSPERMRDLRSHHVQGKQEFIDFVKPSNKVVLYEKINVVNWLNNLKGYSFGSAKEDPDNDQ